jgi:uncharacterized membrane protein
MIRRSEVVVSVEMAASAEAADRLAAAAPRAAGNSSMRALSLADRERITAATTAMRQRTGVEVVVTVRNTSDHYAPYPLLWAGLFSIAFLAVLSLFLPRLPLRFGVLLQALFLLVAGVALDVPSIKIRLAPRHVRQAAARALARREFAAHATASSDRRGLILLFASLGEHHFEIIADHTVNQSVESNTWEMIVKRFTQLAKTQPLAEGLHEAIAHCSAVLESCFAKKVDLS